MEDYDCGKPPEPKKLSKNSENYWKNSLTDPNGSLPADAPVADFFGSKSAYLPKIHRFHPEAVEKVKNLKILKKRATQI